MGGASIKKIEKIVRFLVTPIVFMGMTIYLAEEKATRISAYVDDSNRVEFNEGNSSIVANWNYNEVKTVNIAANVEGLDLDTRYLKIRLPVGMEYDFSPETLVNGQTFNSIDVSKYKKYTTTTVDGHTYTPNTGEVTYKIPGNVKQFSMDMLFSVDAVFWNTVDGVIAHDAKYKAIELIIGDKNTSQTIKIDRINVVGRAWGTYSDSTSDSVMERDTPANIYTAYSLGYVQNPIASIYSNIETEIDVPYSIGPSGEKKYVDVTEVRISDGGVYKIENGKIKITWKNSYISTFNVYVYFTIPSSRFGPNESIKYSYGHLRNKEYFTDSWTTMRSATERVIKTAPAEEQISMSGSTRQVYNGEQSNAVSHLGYFSIVNSGAKSEEKRVAITFPEDGVGVTTVRLPMTTDGLRFGVEYKLKSIKTGQIISGKKTFNKGTTGDSEGYLITRETLAKEMNIDYKDYYIKELRYDAGRFRTGYMSYSRSGGNGTQSSGNYYGVVLNKQNLNAVYTADVQVTGDKYSKSTSASSQIISQGKAAAYVGGFGFSDDSGKGIREIRSGRDISVKGDFGVSLYPYYTTTYMNDPVVYLRVPKEITIDESKTKFSTSGNNIPFEIVNKNNPRIIDNGFVVYEIVLKKGMGAYNETLGAVAHVNYNIVLKVSKLIRTTSLNSREMLFISDRKVIAEGGGSLDGNYTRDIWDVNGNGSTSDRLATTKPTIPITITSDTNALDMEIYSSINDKPYTQQKLLLPSVNDTLNLKMVMDNIHGGHVPIGKFDYYIPIPKKSGTTESSKPTSEKWGVEMKLKEYLIERNGYDIKYSSDGARYVDKSRISLEDITMINIKSTKEIKPGEKVEFVIKLQGIVNSYSVDGQDTVWNIYGSQEYRKNDTKNSFNQTLDKFIIEVPKPNKPVMKDEKASSVYMRKEPIVLSWDKSFEKGVTKSKVMISSDGNIINTEIVDSVGEKNFHVVNGLREGSSYDIDVVNINDWGVVSDGARKRVRVEIFETKGNVLTKEVITSKPIKFVEVVPTIDMPSGTKGMVKIHYKGDNPGIMQFDIEDKGVKRLPSTTNNLKIEVLMENSSSPVDYKLSPKLDAIQVYAK